MATAKSNNFKCVSVGLMFSPKIAFTFSNETSGECFTDAMEAALLDNDKQTAIAAKKNEKDFSNWKCIVSP